MKMSIESTKATPTINALTATQDKRASSHTERNEPVCAVDAQGEMTDVTLSTLTKHIQTNNIGDVNYARVAEVRAALAADGMPIEPDNIAQSLVQQQFQF